MGWLNNTLTTVFSWFKPKEDTGNPTKQTQRRPKNKDITEYDSVNRNLTYGLYHNSYPGMKLSGAMAFTPIAVPIWFMGVPTPITEDKKTQEIINDIIDKFYRVMNQIHLQCHRDGTIWIFPKFSAKTGSLIWEFIHDDSVVDIIKDLETGEPIEIITDEEIIITTGENRTATIRRKRYYTKEKIAVRWIGGTTSLPERLKDLSFRNTIGALPIPFSNNADADEVRGHSDYERIVSDLKDYHDIDLKQSTFLAKFEPKLAINVKNVNEWLNNNGEEENSLSTLEIFERDLLFLVDEEKAQYIYPATAYQAYDNTLKRKYRKIVEGSGVPEMLWGTKMEGNHASAQEQMNNVVKFVEEKRDQKNASYQKLFEASVALILKSTMTDGDSRIIAIEWNSLDALSDEIKAKIIKDFAQGLAFLVDKASITKEMMYQLWDKMFPGLVPEDFEEFKIGISDMAKHRQFVNTDYATAADMTGMEGELQDDEGGV